MPVIHMELLARFLQAATPGESDRFLEELLEKVARPLIARVVRSRLLFFDAARADVDDACAETLFEVLARLRAAQSGSAAIGNFEAYVAGMAYRVASETFSSRFPERKRLRYRLRYVLTSDARFRFWQAPGGAWLAALKGVDGLAAAAAALESCRSELPAGASEKLADVVARILRRLNSPVELNDLTSAAARLTGLVERSMADPATLERITAAQPNPADRAELLDWVRAVWQEIAELPERQRIALVLGLRAPEGSAAWLITDLGIASFRGLAAILGMPAPDLADLWNRLPLDDREIAERLELDRQQVINLRSAARRRLARRMSAR
jgi:hypothetical protein